MKKLRAVLVVILLLSFTVIPYSVINAGGTQGLVAHYKFDGDFNDSSGNGLNGTQVGDISFIDSVIGKGAKFEGGYIEVPHNDLLNLENGYTFSVWLYKETPKTQMYQPILSKEGAEKSPTQNSYYFANNQERPCVFTWQNSSLRANTSKQWIDYQKWTLCTITVDSQNIRYFIDGKLIDSSTAKSAFPKSTGRLFIGYRTDAFGATFYRGAMDDLKIFNYAMTPAEVQKEFDAVANGSAGGKYVIKRPKNLMAFYRFENNLEDASGNLNNGTAVAAEGSLTYVDGICGKALKFDGASYIEVEDSDSLDMDNGFTCSAWIYIDSSKKSGNAYQPIIAKLDGDTLLWRNKSAYRAFVAFDDKWGVELHRGDAPSEGFAASFVTPRTPNKWYMVTMTSNGEDVKCYIDGVLKQTIKRKNFIPHSMGKLLIGSNISYNSMIYFKGIMDELRLFNYELSANQVKELYGIRDTLLIKASKTTLDRKESLKLTTQLMTYPKYQYSDPRPDTGTNRVIVGVGLYNSSFADVTAKVTFTSTNTKVLTVSTSGTVTAVGKGTASVIATYSPIISASKEFTVK